MHLDLVNILDNLQSTPNAITDVSNGTLDLITPPSGKRLLVRSIYVSSNSATGTLKIIRESGTVLVLPVYLANKSEAYASGNLHLYLDVDEKLQVVKSGIQASSEIFIGVTYRLLR